MRAKIAWFGPDEGIFVGYNFVEETFTNLPVPFVSFCLVRNPKLNAGTRQGVAFFWQA